MTSGARDTSGLRELLGGYLHQDFIAEYGSVEAAVRAYCADAPRAARRRAARELRALLASYETLEELRAAFVALRSGWRPRDRRSVERVLAILEAEGE